MQKIKFAPRPLLGKQNIQAKEIYSEACYFIPNYKNIYFDLRTGLNYQLNSFVLSVYLVFLFF